MSLHHSFDLALAIEYGIEEAILIHHFQHWIRLNKKRNINCKEGRTWTYQTIEEIADHFPYWTLEQVREIVDRLAFGKNRKSKKESGEFKPVLIKGNFNKAPFDRTTWYAFFEEERFLNILYERGNPQIEKGVSPNPIGHFPRPIPDTKTDAKDRSSSSKVPKPQPENPEAVAKRMEDDSISTREEEELQKRLKNRSKDLEPIKDMAKWRKVVLDQIRQGFKDFATKEDLISKHKAEAKALDMGKLGNSNVLAFEDRVELCNGVHMKSIPYDVTDEEWRSVFK